MSRRPWAVAPALAAVALLACGRTPDPAPAGDPGTADSARPRAAAEPGTPVTVAEVARATLASEVTAPGETVALIEEKLRAPFSGVLDTLDVVEGDRVRDGQVVGRLVARDSAAALAGAREMARAARTPEERADAERAVELAESHRVTSPLVASVSGVVVSRAAAAGDRVGEDQELLTIAAADSLVFRARVAQSDLSRVRPGQRAEIALSGGSAPLAGLTHGLLAGADAADLTVPVRIDFARAPEPLAEGLFGTARIVVAEHREVLVVPRQAVLRDDVSGVTRVARAGDDGRLHWVEVATGLTEDDRVEVSAPGLAAGQKVVTAGQVGLDEGTPLAIRP
jgi:multidrug efflux pump subunit AcrA (membrane-fusion protein)